MKARYLLASCLSLILMRGLAMAAAYDLSGTWTYATSNHVAQGSCPAGTDSTGQLTITQSGDSFTLVIVSGMTCDPAVMCTFEGMVLGDAYTCSNSAVVDDEGGTATNTLAFTATSATQAVGKDASEYSHPQGFTCVWGFDISMTRTSGADGGGGTLDSGGGVLDAGPSAGDSAAESDSGVVGPDGGVGDVDAGSGDKDDSGGCQIGSAGRPVAVSGLLLLILLLFGRCVRRRACARGQNR